MTTTVKEKPRKINICMLFIGLIMDMIVFFACYTMITNHEKTLNDYIFSHKNRPLDHHPFEDKLLMRIDELDKKITIVNERCINKK